MSRHLRFFRRVIVADEVWLVAQPDGSHRLCRPDTTVAETGRDESGKDVRPAVLWPGSVLTLAYYVDDGEECEGCQTPASEYRVHNHGPR